MKEIQFRVKGSAATPYEVIFIRDGDSLTAICDCPAGQHSNACKHRLSILDGKARGIVSDNADQVPTVVVVESASYAAHVEDPEAIAEAVSSVTG